jgi:hypothetical protein
VADQQGNPKLAANLKASVKPYEGAMSCRPCW